MNKFDELKGQVADLLKDATDPETLKGLGSINTAIDQLAKDEEELLQKQHETARLYREAVMNAPLPAQHTPEETGKTASAGKSWEECINEVLNAQKGK